MKSAWICIALAVVLAVCSFSGQASQPRQSEIDSADRLFQVGKFAQADKLYLRKAAQNPKDHSVAFQLGRIALLSNRLRDAQKWLERTLALQPGDVDAKVMLAQTFYRRDDFQKAAASLSGVEVSSNKLLVSQYPTLATGQRARKRWPRGYLLHRHRGFRGRARHRVRPGAWRPPIRSGASTFSGGQHAEVQNGRIESLTVGDWTVKNLPVATLALRQLSEGFGVKRIDGIIGTNLLYHFLATLDYPHSELVLRRKTAKNLEQFAAASSGKGVAVPFWIASDHFMVGWGRVETLPPTLLFVDSGLAGAGVKLAEPVIKEAGIKLEVNKAYEGAGGGGKLKLVPYTVRQLSFGDVQESNVPGIYDGPFPWGNTFGFHIAGMVGHDFFKPYAVTFDFQDMQIFLQKTF
jgi:hypothetical protein